MNYEATSNNRNSITVMSYDEYEDIRESMNARRRMRASKERERRARYYKRQRLMGIAVLLVGILCLIAGCVLSAAIIEYFGVAVGAFGIHIIVTKQMILVDKYYLECQDKLMEY